MPNLAPPTPKLTLPMPNLASSMTNLALPTSYLIPTHIGPDHAYTQPDPLIQDLT